MSILNFRIEEEADEVTKSSIQIVSVKLIPSLLNWVAGHFVFVNELQAKCFFYMFQETAECDATVANTEPKK